MRRRVWSSARGLSRRAEPSGLRRPAVLRVEPFGVGDGLPSSEVLDLAHDPSGRILVVTSAGTVLYDDPGRPGGGTAPGERA